MPQSQPRTLSSRWTIARARWLRVALAAALGLTAAAFGLAGHAPRLALVEMEINRDFARALGGHARLWHVDARHTDGLARHPSAYRARVQAFLAREL